MKKEAKILGALVFFLICLGINQCGKKKSKADLPLYALTFKGSTFEMHNGQTLFASLVDKESLQTIVTKQVVVQDGAFELPFDAFMVRDQDYYLDYFIDQNGNNLCDPPPVDHSWRINIENVKDTVLVADTHHMGFSEVCPQTKLEETHTLKVSGTLLFADHVQASGAIIPGKPVANGKVFLEGFPAVSVNSGVDGSFVLKLNIPSADLELLDSQLHAVMWYTEAQSEEVSSWSPAQTRLGSRKGFDRPDKNMTVDLGTISLDYTKRATFKIVDADDLLPLTACWIHLPDYDFQLGMRHKGAGEYFIDYLPPGDYRMTIGCDAHQILEKTFTMDLGTELGQSKDLGQIAVIKVTE